MSTTDIVAQIDALAADEKCPNCGRQWHERPLSLAVAQMHDRGHIDYLTTGSALIGPRRPPWEPERGERVAHDRRPAAEMKASEVLAAARDEIEKGWTQGTFENSAGQVCAVGAIQRATAQHKGSVTGLDGFIDLCSAQESATAALEELVREHGEIGIMGFNDSRTEKQEVLDLFDKAIAGLEEKGE